EANEGPLSGFLFDLIDANTGVVLRTVASDANGHWEFLSLAAGTYQVREQPFAGFTQTTANPPNFVLGPTSQLDDAAAFGNFRNITFTGAKFNDLNGNGARDPGEPGLQNFSFRLTNSITG